MNRYPERIAPHASGAAHLRFIELCSTGGVDKPHVERQRAAARDALAGRTRKITRAALTVSALLSAGFAGLAAASAPGKQLRSRLAPSTPIAKRSGEPVNRSAVIPPLPAPAGPGSRGAPAPPPAATPAPAPTSAPPVVVSGGS